MTAPAVGGLGRARWIGATRRRVEDRPLLTGRGRFTGDVARPGTLHVWFVRSPHAHARITALDVAAAAASPGVVRVVTAEDVRPLGQPSVNPFFPEMKVAPHPLLADGAVRAVGEPVAAVVAETAAVARDAAERVRVEYERRPAVVDAGAALRDDAPVIHPGLGTNRAFVGAWRAGDMATARATAARAIRLRVEQARLAAVPLEPRAILAEWDGAAGELTVWTSTQVPFRVRSELALILGLGEERIRVIAPDVGGGFGAKGAAYRDEALVAWLALTLGRPVKWVSTRGEDFLTTQQGRGARADGTLYVTADGRIAGLEARIVLPLGAQAMINGPAPARNHARTLPGAYVVPAVDIEVTGAYTTTPPTGPYRGAGRPEGIFLIERLVDEAARALGLDPAEMRRRNFVPAGAFPYRTATGQVYDSGDYARSLDRLLELAGYATLRAQQAAARARGELVGIGLSTFIEPSGGALWEGGHIRVERSGEITVFTGAGPHGQGSVTALAQIVADRLRVPVETIRVRHGDTAATPPGVGSFGSRTVVLAGSALARAAERVEAKARRIAAHLLECAPEDVERVAGGFGVAGATGRAVTLAQIAHAAYTATNLPDGEEPGLEATALYRQAEEMFPFGAYLAVVRIDPETGQVHLEHLVGVDDSGVIINPLLAHGQIQGAIVQGIGQALLEQIIYDASGQLVTGSLLDYAAPRADTIPWLRLDLLETPSPLNPLGAKGLGEAGTVGAPAAVINAVVDALAERGVRQVDMPATAQQVWRLLRSGQG